MSFYNLINRLLSIAGRSNNSMNLLKFVLIIFSLTLIACGKSSLTYKPQALQEKDYESAGVRFSSEKKFGVMVHWSESENQRDDTMALNVTIENYSKQTTTFDPNQVQIFDSDGNTLEILAPEQIVESIHLQSKNQSVLGRPAKNSYPEGTDDPIGGWPSPDKRGSHSIGIPRDDRQRIGYDLVSNLKKENCSSKSCSVDTIVSQAISRNMKPTEVFAGSSFSKSIWFKAPGRHVLENVIIIKIPIAGEVHLLKFRAS